MLIITTKKRQLKMLEAAYELGLALGYGLRENLRDAEKHNKGVITGSRMHQDIEEILRRKED